MGTLEGDASSPGAALMDHDHAVAYVEAQRDYRVLRRVPPWPGPQPTLGEYEDHKTAIFLDVETTGINPKTDKVIELVMMPFTYGATSGIVADVMEPFHGYNYPGMPIPANITALTGITDEMLVGQKFDVKAIEAFASGFQFCIAHHAKFDRPFVETISPVFSGLHWACSMEQVPWKDIGITGRSLDYIAFRLGWFYDAHKAQNDCHAAISILARAVEPITGPHKGDMQTIMRLLLEEARKPHYRVWAFGSPIGEKDKLKDRGYRWEPAKKTWHTEVGKDAVDAELAWLAANAKTPGGEAFAISPLNRFTDRV